MVATVSQKPLGSISVRSALALGPSKPSWYTHIAHEEHLENGQPFSFTSSRLNRVNSHVPVPLLFLEEGEGFRTNPETPRAGEMAQLGTCLMRGHEDMSYIPNCLCENKKINR
jgi:hypothetical protein